MKVCEGEGKVFEGEVSKGLQIKCLLELNGLCVLFL